MSDLPNPREILRAQLAATLLAAVIVARKNDGTRTELFGPYGVFGPEADIAKSLDVADRIIELSFDE